MLMAVASLPIQIRFRSANPEQQPWWCRYDREELMGCVRSTALPARDFRKLSGKRHSPLADDRPPAAGARCCSVVDSPSCACKAVTTDLNRNWKWTCKKLAGR